LRGDRTLTIAGALVVALAYGITFGLATGTAFGLAYLLAGGLAGSDSQAWAVYVIATVRLAASGRTPLRLMAFLDDVQRIGLLRTTGPRYQFRHENFQKYLAAEYLNSS
jgi:hypothetical protein